MVARIDRFARSVIDALEDSDDVQNVYAKIGVSSRAAATMFAMEHGLVAWGESPMEDASGRS